MSSHHQVPKNTNATSPCSLRSSIGQGVRRAPRRSHLGRGNAPSRRDASMWRTTRLDHLYNIYIYVNIILYILYIYYMYIIYNILYYIYIYILYIYIILYIHIVIYFIYNIHIWVTDTIIVILLVYWVRRGFLRCAQNLHNGRGTSLYRCPFLGWVTS